MCPCDQATAESGSISHGSHLGLYPPCCIRIVRVHTGSKQLETPDPGDSLSVDTDPTP